MNARAKRRTMEGPVVKVSAKFLLFVFRSDSPAKVERLLGEEKEGLTRIVRIGTIDGTWNISPALPFANIRQESKSWKVQG